MISFDREYLTLIQDLPQAVARMGDREARPRTGPTALAHLASAEFTDSSGSGPEQA